MSCACSRCGRRSLPRAPGLDGVPVAHTREIRQGGDEQSYYCPCTNVPNYEGVTIAIEELEL